MGSLRGKVAIVTGAGRQNGMGFAAAKAMASAGADVVVTDLTLRRAELDYLGIYSANDNLASLEDRAKELEALGVRSLAIGADVTKPEEIRACVETTVDTFGSVDVLFNNAGTAVGVGPYLEIEDRQWDLSYQIHVKGTADFCKAVIPKMQARGGGSVVNNSSMWAVKVAPEAAAYIATKAAVIALTKVLALEFADDNIRFNAVAPGTIQSVR